MQCRAVLIDPELRTIQTIQTCGAPSDVRLIIKAPALTYFRIYETPQSWDYCWLDMSARRHAVHGFHLFAQTIPGRSVIIGTDKATGCTVDTSLSQSAVEKEIDWLGLIQPLLVGEDHGQET